MKEHTLKTLHDSVERSPNDIKLRLELAHALQTASKHSEAEDEFIKVLALDKNNLEAKCGLAKSCYELREFSTAFSMLEDICKRSDTGTEYQTLYAQLLIREMQEEQLT